MNNSWTELYHHGVKGQHWGQRRWQNPDGSLTPAGYAHYGYKGDNIRISKGEQIYRMSLAPSIDRSKSNNVRQYYSTTKEDNDIWKNFFKPYYGDAQKQTSYKATKDLNVANQEELADATRKAVRTFLNSEQKNYVCGNAEKFRIENIIANAKLQCERIESAYYKNTGVQIKLNPDAVVGAQIISRIDNSITSQNIQHQLVKKGKDALLDVWGLDVANSPVVILNPNKGKLKSDLINYTKTDDMNTAKYAKENAKKNEKIRKLAKKLSNSH